MSERFISTLISIAMSAVTDVSFPPCPRKYRVHGVFLAEHVHRPALSQGAHPIRRNISTVHQRHNRSLLERAHELAPLVLPPDKGDKRGRDEAVHAYRDVVTHRRVRVRDHRVEAMLIEREH